MKYLIKKLLLILIIAFFLAISIDYVLVMLRNDEPLFIIKEKDNIKYGLLYNFKYNDNQVIFSVLNIKLKEKDLPKNNLEIIDKTDNCVDEVYNFYEDSNYIYSFNCHKNYYVKKDNVLYSLKNALKNGLITIQDLEEENIQFNKTPKN